MKLPDPRASDYAVWRERGAGRFAACRRVLVARARRYHERALPVRARRYFNAWRGYGVTRADALRLARYALHVDRRDRAQLRLDRHGARVARRLQADIPELTGRSGRSPDLQLVEVRIDDTRINNNIIQAGTR